MAVDLTYPNLLKVIAAEISAGHSESRAFLAWFLKHIYRLDDNHADDAVCDGPDDKGVDGIYIDEETETIVVFQSKLVQSANKTLGDVALKEFVGTLSQLKDTDEIRDMADSTENVELRGLLTSSEVADKVENGWVVRGVFVTNAKKDHNAENFLAADKNITVMDASTIDELYIRAERPRSDRGPFEFDVSGVDVATFPLDASTEVVMTSVLASDLVKLEDLASGELFERNVRQWLGRTKVNKDIAKSVKTASEHKNFLLYHNGITMICSGIDLSKKGRLVATGYSVINGCQSLTTLHENAASLTPDLRVIARFIRIPDDSPLVDKITLNSNNQNGTKARDLKSNSPTQIRLQNEFAMHYGEKVFYAISRGERSDCPIIIDNELAGRLLLSFDLKEPWSAHQGYRLFDDLYNRIFARPEVDAHRIWALYNIFSVVREKVSQLSNPRFAGYGQTSFYLMYLVAEALEADALGAEFVNDPGEFVADDESTDQLKAAVGQLLDDVIVDLNAEVEERGEGFDYKRDLKSQTAVRALSKDVIASYLKVVQRGRTSSFSQDIEAARRE